MILTRLAELGFQYDTPDPNNGVFCQAVRTGDLIYVSGQLPTYGDEQIKGKVGADVSFDQAQRAAVLCAYNCLRAIGTIADVESITQVVKLFGMVNVADGFDNTSGVINAASDFLRNVLKEPGWHARSAMGMVVPLGWAVEIEMIVAVSGSDRS